MEKSNLHDFLHLIGNILLCQNNNNNKKNRNNNNHDTDKPSACLMGKRKQKAQLLQHALVCYFCFFIQKTVDADEEEED